MFTSSQHVPERNQDATIYVGNITEACNEELLWELFVQVGPVVNVHIPKDKVTGAHTGFGFVEFRGEEDADYAIKIMNMIKLHGQPLRLNKKVSDGTETGLKQVEVGANLFIGNLDPEVDEKLLYDTFSAFGVILGNTPKVMRDMDTQESKGFAFVNFDCFEAADMAIEAMEGQYLCGKPISVQYAYKKDGTKGERHGSVAERLLAQNNPSASQQGARPHTMFASAPGVVGGGPPGMPPPPPGGAMPPPPPPGICKDQRKNETCRTVRPCLEWNNPHHHTPLHTSLLRALHMMFSSLVLAARRIIHSLTCLCLVSGAAAGMGFPGPPPGMGGPPPPNSQFPPPPGNNQFQGDTLSQIPTRSMQSTPREYPPMWLRWR